MVKIFKKDHLNNKKVYPVKSSHPSKKRRKKLAEEDADVMTMCIGFRVITSPYFLYVSLLICVHSLEINNDTK